MEAKFAAVLLLFCVASALSSEEDSPRQLNDCTTFECPIGTYCTLKGAENQPICKRLPTCKWRCRNCMLDTSYCTDPNDCVPRQICAAGPGPCESAKCSEGQFCVNKDHQALCITK